MYIKVDGMMSGTGIRDSVNGGYINPAELGLSQALIARLNTWLEQYIDAHCSDYADEAVCRALDKEGLLIAQNVREELPTAKVGYFSDWLAKNVEIERRI